MPFFGGFDGIDIKKADPFSNTNLSSGTETSNYVVYSLNKAIDIVSDKDIIRYDLISMPGVINHSLNTKLVNMVTERGDALAIIDREGIFQPDTDNNGTEQAASLTTVISKMKTDVIDSSYGAAYFPNVRVKDTVNPAGNILVMPPSVAAIGAIGASEAASQPWFAPAGFNRGGLSTLGGVGGPSVVGTVEHLTKDDRDDLYEVSLNPIARFPATSDIVIFGQKTLQTQMSALDRINVRRLMIYLKKQIGDIADTILFDANIQATWNRFKSRAEVVLAQAKSEGGITEYKLVLDETTTTPDLIDRNILYAQVFIKPARAIEFIAIDFVITNTGVEF
jgi:phage tail sheath protein FI